ncbi:MAG: uracil-DNA glycosylase [Methyloprofundus sp.]|nr:uracil-DNA glycosylase [Methyloprofundus sp.]
MNNSTRLQYLSAMGIDVWLPRYVEESATETADTWQSLHAEMSACQQCELAATRQQVVLGSGNQEADFFWVTEAPSMEDEQQGEAFSDHSAELFTEMLRAMNLNRSEVFMTHIVKCRPPEDRKPRVKELASCEDFLLRQIALVQPKIMIAVGGIAAHKLLASKAPLAELRETTHEFAGIPLLTLYHPAYLLRSLTEKSKAWQDMQKALTLFEQIK